MGIGPAAPTDIMHQIILTLGKVAFHLELVSQKIFVLFYDISQATIKDVADGKLGQKITGQHITIGLDIDHVMAEEFSQLSISKPKPDITTQLLGPVLISPPNV